MHLPLFLEYLYPKEEDDKELVGNRQWWKDEANSEKKNLKTKIDIQLRLVGPAQE